MLIETVATTEALIGVAGTFLSAHEPENTILLGALRGQGLSSRHQPLCLIAKEAETLAMVGLRTPPFPLILSRGDPAPAEAIARHLLKSGEKIPGVIGPEDLAERFTTIWTEATDTQAAADHGLILHRLTEAQAPTGVEGELRMTEAKDSELFGIWNHRAAIEMGLLDHEIADAATEAARRIDLGQVFAWYRGEEPVSLVAFQPTSLRDRCGRINMVYTPDHERGRGYASAAVAALSHARLRAGWSSCLIFTDAANPTTNKIYRQVGYRVLGRYSNISFRPA